MCGWRGVGVCMAGERGAWLRVCMACEACMAGRACMAWGACVVGHHPCTVRQRAISILLECCLV